MCNANSATVVVWFQRPAFFYLHMYLCMNFKYLCFDKKKTWRKFLNWQLNVFSGNHSIVIITPDWQGPNSILHSEKNELWQGMNRVKFLTVWQLQYKNGKSEFKIGNMYFTRKYLETCQYVWFFFAIVTSFKNCLKWQLTSTLCLKLRNVSTLSKFSYFIKSYGNKVHVY